VLEDTATSRKTYTRRHMYIEWMTEMTHHTKTTGRDARRSSKDAFETGTDIKLL
jgi:hypothetical protein